MNKNSVENIIKSAIINKYDTDNNSYIRIDKNNDFYVNYSLNEHCQTDKDFCYVVDIDTSLIDNEVSEGVYEIDEYKFNNVVESIYEDIEEEYSLHNIFEEVDTFVEHYSTEGKVDKDTLQKQVEELEKPNRKQR